MNCSITWQTGRLIYQESGYRALDKL